MTSEDRNDKRDRLKKLCNELRFNANHGLYVTKVSADLQHSAADAIEELQSAPSAGTPREQALAEALQLVLDDWANGNVILEDAMDRAHAALALKPISSSGGAITRTQIEGLLHQYRCQFTQDDDGNGAQLVDVFTPLDYMDIAPGKEEIHLLADFLASELGSIPSHVSPRQPDNIGDSDRWEDPRDISGGQADTEDARRSNVSPSATAVTDEMVSRFLAWRLPEDFHPDAGISFDPLFNVEYNARLGKPPQRHEPIGTNLLNADQARAMLEHVLGTTKSARGEGR